MGRGAVGSLYDYLAVGQVMRKMGRAVGRRIKTRIIACIFAVYSNPLSSALETTFSQESVVFYWLFRFRDLV